MAAAKLVDADVKSAVKPLKYQISFRKRVPSKFYLVIMRERGDKIIEYATATEFSEALAAAKRDSDVREMHAFFGHRLRGSIRQTTTISLSGGSPESSLLSTVQSDVKSFDVSD